MEDNTRNLGVRPLGGDLANIMGTAKKDPSEGGFTTEETSRKDNYSGNTTNDEQDLGEVAEDTSESYQVEHEAPQSGNIYTWAITAGNGSGDWEINNKGELSRVTGHTLVGSYTLTVRYVESSVLRRYQDVTISVSVA